MKTVVLEHTGEILFNEVPADKLISVWKNNDLVGHVFKYSTDTLMIYCVPENSFGGTLFSALSLEGLIKEGIDKGYEFTID